MVDAVTCVCPGPANLYQDSMRSPVLVLEDALSWRMQEHVFQVISMFHFLLI